MISSFTTKTAYLSLNLVGSLHKQLLASIYFDSDGNHEYNKVTIHNTRQHILVSHVRLQGFPVYLNFRVNLILYA